ncbi:hypothetical protein FZC76_07790 [Sutcliffiella horikoshii]|uniref:Uncharacterized protein n=1 Tax=Sutcliffiella horikoshii TaxID=79883 RepID=A0A5D4T1J3_9BACI|nr:hypothetical protein [Sutcliffiella horikoshii]TYS68831.1 hypothetical protein FZC76_07790 [Sutcliffiella horikoshii]
MYGLFSFNSEDFTFPIDEAVHKVRGKYWDKKIKEDFELRKRQALGMFREQVERNRSRNTVFKIADVCKLPIMTVCDLEAKYLKEIHDRNKSARERLSRFLEYFGTTPTKFEALSGIKVVAFLEGENLSDKELREIHSFLDRLNSIEI